jgi:Mg2+-importing ATPase
MMKKLKKKIADKVFQNNQEFPAVAVEKLRKIALLNPEDAVHELETSFSGLDENDVKKMIQLFGLNKVQREKAASWPEQLLAAFINPFIGILLIIAAVSFVIDVWLEVPEERDYKTIVVVSVMIFISVVLRFIQEYRSSQAAEKPERLVTNTQR